MGTGRAGRSALIIKIGRQYKWRCCHCGRGCALRGKMGNVATLDHIIPKSAGGTNEQANLALACYRCNKLRGNTPFDAFRELAQQGGLSECVPGDRGLTFNEAEPRGKAIPVGRKIRLDKPAIKQVSAKEREPIATLADVWPG